MASREFRDVLNDCIDRLAAGQTVDDCLRTYPEYAAALEPMLEAGRLALRSRSTDVEVSAAQADQRRRFEQALRARSPLRRRTSLQETLGLVATFALVFMLLLSVASIAAQDSLPGDALFSLKLLTEQVRLGLSGNDLALNVEFNQRRIDETRRLLTLRREIEVTFEGVVEISGDARAVVAGLTIVLTEEIPGQEFLIQGARVAVRAITTAGGELAARSIRLLDSPPIEETATATLSPTPFATRRPLVSSTTTPQERTQPTETPESTRAPTACIVSLPAGWTAYTVQSGDTLSGLAAESGTTLRELMQVNCMADASRIRVGERLYLARQPVRPPTPEATHTAAATDTESSNSGETIQESNRGTERPTRTPQATPTRDGRGG